MYVYDCIGKLTYRGSGGSSTIHVHVVVIYASCSIVGTPPQARIDVRRCWAGARGCSRANVVDQPRSFTHAATAFLFEIFNEAFQRKNGHELLVR